MYLTPVNVAKFRGETHQGLTGHLTGVSGVASLLGPLASLTIYIFTGEPGEHNNEKGMNCSASSLIETLP